MRAPILHDVLRVAAVLRLAHGQRARHRKLIALFNSADRADAERRANGRSALGDGSLAASCAGDDASSVPAFGDPEYCECIAMVCRLLARSQRTASGSAKLQG
jgi:hypothetical protein